MLLRCCCLVLLWAAGVRADDPWRLDGPIWSSQNVRGESVLFVQDDDASPANARLLLPAAKVLKVARADGTQTFVAGQDYTVDAATGTIALPATSRISFLKADELFPPAGSPRSIQHKAGDPTRGVLFDNEHWFHDHQIEVTYEVAEPWKGYRPQSAGKSLPRTLAKLQAGQPLTIGFSGDSITFGLNASGLTDALPKQPIYPKLVADRLQEKFGSKVTLVNRAVGGWRVQDGLEDLPKLLEAKPDLVVIAYGMNHVGARDPDGFKQLLKTLIERIRAADANTEMILVAPMHGNHQWVHTPAEQFSLHRDAIAALVGPGMALADMTTLWQQILERKRDCDLTGNGVNHPNDFGHRLHAQVILELLSGDPSK